MFPHPTFRSARLGLLATSAALALAAAAPAHAIEFLVTNLVSDGTVPAHTIDPQLVNPWGVSFAPSGPFWISDNGKSVTTLYNGAGDKIAALPQVAIPPPGSAPTGQVFNSGGAGAFAIGGAKPLFLFDGEDGHITGWAPSMGTTAQVGFTSTDGAIYKGLAIANSGSDSLLFAADFHNNAVEVFKNSLSAPSATFTDPTVAAGYAPFNVQTLNGKIYVTFAKQDDDAEDDVAGAGNGYVDVFNLDGTLDHRIASAGDQINSPWGLAIAPTSFGMFAGDLLVGNFGDGTISVFDPGGGGFLGKLRGTDGHPLVFGDLWALTPGNGALAGDTQKIYFTAGLSDEAHGLFGSLTAVPEPWTWTLMTVGFGLVGGMIRSRRRAVAAV
jgi:uncharacterized protein (TIGR03118 family)